MKNCYAISIFFSLFVSLITGFIIIETVEADSSNIYVPGDYPTIQEAINQANDSDIVHVTTGTYSENLVIDKSLTITGEGGGTKTISGSNTNKHTIEITANDVTLTGFTVDNTVGESSHYSCIFLDTVTDCTMQSNTIQNGKNGIYIKKGGSHTISSNTINDNTQNGIWFFNSDGNTINSNTIQNNGIGIYLESGSSDNHIHNNIISDNSDGINALASNNRIYLNHFSSNSANNAYDSSSNYYYSESNQGNYWDDYTGKDSNSDGFGDTPYDIPGGSNQDLYVKGDFVTQNQDPVAHIDSITPNPAIQGETVSFNGHGTDDESIVYWEWKIDDSVVSNSEDFEKSDLSVGTYSVYYRVKDNDGTWSTYDYDELTINSADTQENQIPTAIIIKPTPQMKVYGDIVWFQGQGVDIDGDITAYKWTSNLDGIISGEKQFTYDDLSIGEHTIYFKVMDNFGQWSSEVTTAVNIEPDPDAANNPPTADIGGPYSGNIGESITFDASDSTDPDAGDSLSYHWVFGDGNNSDGASVQHTYESEGTYTVTLTVRDSYGETSIVSTEINITAEKTDNDKEDNDENGISGFEFILVIMALAILFSKKRNKK